MVGVRIQCVLTRAWVTNLSHNLRSAFHVNFHATALKPFDDDAHPPQSRDEVERADNTKFEEMCVLSCSSSVKLPCFNSGIYQNSLFPHSSEHLLCGTAHYQEVEQQFGQEQQDDRLLSDSSQLLFQQSDLLPRSTL